MEALNKASFPGRTKPAGSYAQFRAHAGPPSQPERPALKSSLNRTADRSRANDSNRSRGGFASGASVKPVMIRHSVTMAARRGRLVHALASNRDARVGVAPRSRDSGFGETGRPGGLPASPGSRSRGIQRRTGAKLDLRQPS